MTIYSFLSKVLSTLTCLHLMKSLIITVRRFIRTYVYTHTYNIIMWASTTPKTLMILVKYWKVVRVDQVLFCSQLFINVITIDTTTTVYSLKFFTDMYKVSNPCEKCALPNKFAYYAGIMLDVFAILLCSKLCWHNWLKPTDNSLLYLSLLRTAVLIVLYCLEYIHNIHILRRKAYFNGIGRSIPSRSVPFRRP